MSYNDFCKRGKEFSNVINRILRKEQIEILKKHHQQEDKIYVISASIEEWVAPWCKENGIENLICTKIEVDEKEVITGRFSSANCFGKEKVNRFLEMEPMRDSYFLYAYGDSAGDEAIINFADKGIWCK